MEAITASRYTTSVEIIITSRIILLSTSFCEIEYFVAASDFVGSASDIRMILPCAFGCFFSPSTDGLYLIISSAARLSASHIGESPYGEIPLTDSMKSFSATESCDFISSFSPKTINPRAVGILKS